MGLIIQQFLYNCSISIHYTGRYIIFAKTTLTLNKKGQNIKDVVYRSINEEGYFYIIDGDSIISLNEKVIFSPGTGGFSAHMPKSKKFIICLNFNIGLHFDRTSDVFQGDIWWYGDEYKRKFYGIK
ncbi:MAG: hypothetical protein RQ824_04575 [bacterium]|nr:hypothetical protein [bacterium]